MKDNRITSMAENGPPPMAAATLYPGKVMHQRLTPFGHRFTYSVFSLLVDVDQLTALGRISCLLSVNRPGLLSVWERDHSENGGETLRQFADRLLTRAGLKQRAARILLLAYPRMFGYVFNPISTYFAYDASGSLIAIIYAVRNTFGERHTYVAPVLPEETSAAGIRQSRAKMLHVSPFMEMDLRYHFRILPPGKTVRLRIHETSGNTALLAATFHGNASPINTAALAKLLVRFPLMTMKVIAGIHWQALKLWFKGAQFRRSPPAPATASFGDADIRAGEPVAKMEN